MWQRLLCYVGFHRWNAWHPFVYIWMDVETPAGYHKNATFQWRRCRSCNLTQQERLCTYSLPDVPVYDTRKGEQAPLGLGE